MTTIMTQAHPYLSDVHLALRDQVLRFVQDQVIPVGEAWEDQGMVPRDIFRRMGALGLLGIRVPEIYGGAELDALASVVLAEALGHSTFGGFTASVLVDTDMATPHLTRYGSDAQKAAWLPSIVAGDTITAIAVSEPDAGSDVKSIRTRAVRQGDHWVLNGAKTFITNGVHGDLYIVAAKTALDGKASHGISMFMVEKGTPGFRVSRALKKMGWLSSDTAELVFEDCRIPVENLLGEENHGFYAIMDNFQNERLVMAAMAVGEATKAIQLTLDHLRQREAFGSALWTIHGIRQRLAKRAAETEAARQLVYHAAWLESQGLECIKEVSMAKAFCCEITQGVVYDCVQFHGGMGYMRESAIERMARDARVLTIGGGATEVMFEEVAKRL